MAPLLGLLLLASTAAAAAALTIGCVGDSITEGVGASCPPCTVSPRPLQPCGPAGCAHSWPGQLQVQLGTGHRVWNWGHVAATMMSTTNCARGDPTCSGRNCSAGRTGPPAKPCRSNGPPYWTTNEFAAATNRMAPLDAVVIMLGTNDAKANNWLYLGNETQYGLDAEKMVRTFMSLPQKPRVFLSTPPPLYHPTYTMNQTVVGVVMPAILEHIAVRTGCEFIDMIAPLGGWPTLSEPQLFL
jgi:hypothetical protein